MTENRNFIQDLIYKPFTKRVILLVLGMILSAGVGLSQNMYEVENAFPGVFVPNILGLTAPEGSPYVYLTSQNGQIYRIDTRENEPDRVLWLDIEDILVSGGERGLLGLAFHPDFANNGQFFVNYTAPSPLRTVVSRFEVTDPAAPEHISTLGDPDSEEILLEFNQPFSNHNGGHIAFGPDGYLYIASGDGGSGGDPQNNAQNPQNLLGAMLRIDVNTEAGYEIPSDNPYFDSESGRDEVFAIGLRNPWRFSFDRERGDLWVADVGQNAWEAIHIVENGKNYGWKIIEGSHCFPMESLCIVDGLEFPVFEYNHDNGDRSITGGYVYRGSELSTLQGKYIYGDFISGRVWALDYDHDSDDVISNTELMNNPFNISAFGEDASGEIYILGYGNGTVYRIIEPVSIDYPESVPTTFKLLPAYPNPFNPTTTIRYEVFEFSDVQLSVYSVDGRKVMQLLNESKSPGVYSEQFDATGLTSGIYIVKASLPSGNFMQKITLIK